jgi:hypothetical protein
MNKTKQELENFFFDFQIDFLNERGIDYVPQGLTLKEFKEHHMANKPIIKQNIEPVSVWAERMLAEIQTFIQIDTTGEAPTIEEAEEFYLDNEKSFQTESSTVSLNLVKIWSCLAMIKEGVRPMALNIAEKGEKREGEEQRLKRICKEIENYRKYRQKLQQELNKIKS